MQRKTKPMYWDIDLRQRLMSPQPYRQVTHSLRAKASDSRQSRGLLR